MKKIILASQSPRRRELMESVNIDFTIEVSDIEEVIDESLPVEQAIEQLALQKASVIANQHKEDVVIGADTVVLYDNQILGKPKDLDDAHRMLSMLSGHTHKVITGVAICHEGNNELFHEVTEVTFYELNDDEINRYITTARPLDKAGSYGIQGLGKLFVKEMHGDYCNVVGLPIAQLNQRLKKYI